MKNLLVVLVVSLLCCMSCGSDDCRECPRPPGASGSTPVISDLECNPISAPIDQGGGSTQIDCQVDFIDSDGDLETILFYFKDCGEGPWDNLSIDVRSQAAGIQEGSISFKVPIQTSCEEGVYEYEVSAVDREESESKPLILLFTLAF